ncbi:MAG: hypothetical protein JNK48_28195 [Bryobacterales bacterium]|nr:hypothetical protein [Bryobacterales bacterium]
MSDAPCDDKWRVRLSSRYASYFLSFEEDKESAKIYVVTFDRKAAILWPYPHFLEWRSNLLQSSSIAPESRRQMLTASEFFGGGSEIDRNGRFLLPRAVRDALGLVNPKTEFGVYNDGAIRLATKERLTLAMREFAPSGEQLDSLAVEEYVRLAASPAKPRSPESA